VESTVFNQLEAAATRVSPPQGAASSRVLCESRRSVHGANGRKPLIPIHYSPLGHVLFNGRRRDPYERKERGRRPPPGQGVRTRFEFDKGEHKCRSFMWMS
jgi:hypothetical protein